MLFRLGEWLHARNLERVRRDLKAQGYEFDDVHIRRVAGYFMGRFYRNDGVQQFVLIREGGIRKKTFKVYTTSDRLPAWMSPVLPVSSETFNRALAA